MGPLLVHFWAHSGPVLAPNWIGSGPILAQFRASFGTGSGPGPGSGRSRRWSENVYIVTFSARRSLRKPPGYGPLWLHFGAGFGPGLGPLLAQFRPHSGPALAPFWSSSGQPARRHSRGGGPRHRHHPGSQMRWSVRAEMCSVRAVSCLRHGPPMPMPRRLPLPSLPSPSSFSHPLPCFALPCLALLCLALPGTNE